MNTRSKKMLNPFPNQSFIDLHRDICIVKNAVDAMLPEHRDDDGPFDLPHRPPGCDELIERDPLGIGPTALL